MDLFNIFKGFLGIPNRGYDERGQNGGFHDPFGSPGVGHNEPEDDEDEDLRYPENPQHFGFRVFTDPIEIHRFFEQQMDEMLKSFTTFGSGDMFGSNEFGGFPALGEQKIGKEDEQNPRNQMLKDSDSRGPSWQKPDSEERKDVDLDEKINQSGLASLFQEHESPAQNKVAPRIHSFGKSVTTRIVRRPDGTLEQHRTVRDSSGHEETTVTKQVGDKSHTVTTKVLPSGEKEIVEDFVNLDPEKLADFNKHWQSSTQTPEMPSSAPLADPVFKSIFSKLFP